MTTQARPDWNAEMERQTKATESAQALVKDHEATIQEQRDKIVMLCGALERIAAGNPGKPGGWLSDIEMADIARAALEKAA